MSHMTRSHMTRSDWTTDRIPDQKGRVFVVTGATGGLGLATAHALAAKGARLVLAVRDETRGRHAADLLSARHPDAPPPAVRPLDLADGASVRAFAARLREHGPRPDVLVNNAGVLAPPRTLTPHGHELQLAANHLGHFALTALLLDLLADGDDPRVVTVTSANHRRARIHFDDPAGARSYSPMDRYNQSKLAGALFGHELHRRLTLAASPVRSVLAHPATPPPACSTPPPSPRCGCCSAASYAPWPRAPNAARCPSCTRPPTRRPWAERCTAPAAPANCAAPPPASPSPRAPPTRPPPGACGTCRKT
ncbi:SDR family NAD(P)-dependent oxidoreductase [Kitasatospora sp. Ki12]